MSEAAADNFEFMNDFDKRLRLLAKHAETYVHTDPDSCLFKLRLMIETMARRLVEMQMPDRVSDDLSRMLQSLERSGTIPRREADDMHAIRRDGNAAIHGAPMPATTAMRRLRDAHRLSGWYCRTIKRGAKVRLDAFVAPGRSRDASARVRAAMKRAEHLEDEIETRRQQTRSALLLFDTDEQAEQEATRLRSELDALSRVAAAAGEPLVDADSVALIMAMDLEQLLEDNRLGVTVREAKRSAEQQLDDVKRHFEEHEQEYAQERSRLAEEAQMLDDEQA